VAGSTRPGTAFDELLRVLAENPGVTVEALVMGLAASTAAVARWRGPIGIAAWGAGFLAAALLAPVAAGASVETLGLALGIPLAALFLAYPVLKERR
jgi:hypothetical protein